LTFSLCSGYAVKMRKTSAALLAASAFFMAAVPANAKNPTPKGGGHTPVTICHHAGPTKVITITVDDDGQVQGHLRHGDTLGPCPVVVTPPPTPDPDPAVEPEVPGTPTPPAPEQPAGTPPGVTNPDYVPTPPATPEEPTQVVAPDKVAGKPKPHGKHAQVVARVHKQQAQLVKRVAAARAQEQLPRTGFPAGLILAAGIACIASGLVLRSKSTLT
jgi:hypothetical protein